MTDIETHEELAPDVLAATGKSRKRSLLFLILAAFFLTNALLAELIGGKLFSVTLLGRDFGLSSGIILWPAVFIISDIINEYFGRAGVKKLSLIGAVMIAYAFIALFFCGMPDAASFSPVQDSSFRQVFFQSQWIIVGSIIAFLVAQLLDVSVFWLLRKKTQGAFLWVRATGSTLVSQLVDTFIVGFIGLHLPYRFDQPGVDFGRFIELATNGYLFKFLVALAATPLLYLVHALIDAWLGEDAKKLVDAAAASER